MAAMPSVVQKKEEFKEEFLTCSICSEPYDADQHIAKCLPCLHFFCKNCLSKLASDRVHFSCPKCRHTVKLQGKGHVDSLPNNFVVENLKEYENIFSLSVNCGNCDDGHNAVSFCHDCGCFVCHVCVDGHRRMRTLRLHALSTLEELQEKKMNPMLHVQQKCKKHPKQELTLYCQDDNCKIPACATCAHVDHRNHDLVYIEVAVEHIMSRLQEASEKVKDRHEKLTGSFDCIRQAQTNLETSYNQKVTEIQGTVDELHQMIDIRHAAASEHLQQMFQGEMERLEMKAEAIETLSSQMASALEYTDNACSISHRLQLLDSSQQILQRLSELSGARSPPIEATSMAFVATDNHRKAMRQFEETLSQLCDIALVSVPHSMKSKTSTKTVDDSNLQDTSGKKSARTLSHKEPFNTEPKIAKEGPSHIHDEGKKKSPPSQKQQEDTTRNDHNKPKSSQEQRKDHAPPHDIPKVDETLSTIKLDRNPERGKHCKALLTTVDSTNQPIFRGGAKIQAVFKWSGSLVEGPACTVEDHNTGLYTITYIPLMTGAHELTVVINGKSMEESPFMVLVGH